MSKKDKRKEVVSLLPGLLVSELGALAEVHGPNAKLLDEGYLLGLERTIQKFLIDRSDLVEEIVSTNLESNAGSSCPYSMEWIIDELMKTLLPYAREKYDPDLRDLPFPTYGVTAT